VLDDATYKPVSLAFAQIGTQNGAIAFIDEAGDPGVWLIKLDATVAPVGAPLRLTDLVVAGNSVDLGTRSEDGGAVLYSVNVEANQEVRFRRLDKNGGFLGGEVKIVGAPLQARDASLARIGGGYVVAYRQLSTANMPSSEVRLTFITKEGNVNKDSAGRLISYRVADASPNGGRVTVRLSNDGQLLIGFMDMASGMPQLRLLRKRLDCTL
jgi:hypothetical protein